MRRATLFFILVGLVLFAIPFAVPARAVGPGLDTPKKIADCPFSSGFKVGYDGRQVAACVAAPVSTPSPSGGCPAVPVLTPGQEYSATFAVFCNSPWTTPISANCQTGNCNASWSASLISMEFVNGNTCNGDCVVEANNGGGSFGDTNYYYAQASDPVITVTCTQFCATGSEALPSNQVVIPAVARGSLGCAPVTTDQPMQIIEPNGDDYEFGYVGGCGSGSGGNWRTGDSLSVGAAGKCGNIAQPALGFFQTNPVASAAGHCFLAGAIRANELAAGVIPHALYLTGLCGGSPTGSPSQYPDTLGAHTNDCKGGPGNGPPLGGRLWYDVPCATINTFALTQSEKAILCAFHTYGGYFTDDIGGGTTYTGLGEIGSESGFMFFQYGVTSPFSTLSDWVGNPCPSAGSGTCYYMTSHQTSGGEWNPFTPGTGGLLDPIVHFHWLQPCSAQGTC